MAGTDIVQILNRDRETTGTRPVSPTDISQYVRLDQCQRFLRLQLHTRRFGEDYLTDYDVRQQEIPPILTRSGATFEQEIERQAAAHLPATRLDADQRRANHALNNNADLLHLVRHLRPGDAHIVFQPRLEARIDGWQLRGDIDLLLLQRGADSTLNILIADMKSTTAAKVEHRLQVALYHEMLTTILSDASIPAASIDLAIIYRGPVPGTTAAPDADLRLMEQQQAEAKATLGLTDALMERIDDAPAYIRSARDLLTGSDSVARRVLVEDFDAVPFHLTYKCDGCRFNEFCMKRSAETDDLSLLPHLTEQDKTALRNAGIISVRQVAELKTLSENEHGQRLDPAPGQEHLCRQLATTWPVGQRLDELIHRAQRYIGWKKKKRTGLPWIPHRGYGTLPYNDAELHPNLIRVYIDAQHDYLHDRIYMLGSRIVANENGQEAPGRTRNIVHLTDGPPASNEIERDLFLRWVSDTISAIVELAAPDSDGQPTAPIHLIFVNNFAQRQLLEGVGRYIGDIIGATALYDFMTQIAAFDSPIASFLDQEIREQKNYPMVCQSLQTVAAYLGFDWNAGTRYRDIFRARLFDFWRPLNDAPDGEHAWYTGRARFNSQIPLEFAYVAWREAIPEPETPRQLEDFSGSTPELLKGFHARRLEAMEHIAKDFRGNKQTQLTSFVLPALKDFQQRAPTLAHALDEFITIERFVSLAAWKHDRLPPPEQRVLNGTSLIARYIEADQGEGIADQNRENIDRKALRDQFYEEYRTANPDKKRVTLPKEQREASNWSQSGMRFRLRLETSGTGASLDDALALSDIKPGERLILSPRWTTDSRLPIHEQKQFTPTAKQLLYGQRVDLVALDIDRDDQQRAIAAHAIIEMPEGGGGGAGMGFFFGGAAEPLQPDCLYTLEPDINDFYGYWAKKTVEGLLAGESNAVYNILTGAASDTSPWPDAAAAGQQRFLDGLVALHAAGAMHDFEASKHEFISRHGDSPLLLVQGPPGTGKSYTTAFAILARIQGAMAANIPFRVFLGCKTHAATDVLLHNVQDAIADLHRLFHTHPVIMKRFFDPRLLDLPLYRLRGKNTVRDGITALPKTREKARINAQIEALSGEPYVVVGATPGATYGIIKDRWSNKNLYGHHFVDCVVLDEASQMSIPEAIMATLPLGPDGRLIVVGDHRQMPPIVQHDWSNETRRTFQDFKSYESLFYALLDLKPAKPKINFERSFRLHADLAEFLRKEIYRQDDINYHSTLDAILPRHPLSDDFVAAVLAPEHPLIVIVHDEVRSQHRNAFEQELITPILETLADERLYALTPERGLGVVVPHRAQRAALQQDITALSRIDHETGERILSAVDTVERFQGDERTVIVVSATESDPDYLLATGDFLLDPRRLTVALSRAKQKMVLVASRSVFELFSADEDMFRNAQIWKNLLHDTCTSRLWSGPRGEHHVEVWGN